MGSRPPNPITSMQEWARILQIQLQACKNGLASSKSNYKHARMGSHPPNPISRIQEWARDLQIQFQGCKNGLASSKYVYEVARLDYFNMTKKIASTGAFQASRRGLFSKGVLNVKL